MKTISKLFGVVAAIAALAACNKEVADLKPVVPEGMQKLTLNVSAANPTKVTMDWESGDFAWKIGSNEQIAVVFQKDGETAIYKFENDGNSGDRNHFEGVVDAQYVGTSDPLEYLTDVFYPYDEECTTLDEYRNYSMFRISYLDFTIDTDLAAYPIPLHWNKDRDGDNIALIADRYSLVKINYEYYEDIWEDTRSFTVTVTGKLGLSDYSDSFPVGLYNYDSAFLIEIPLDAEGKSQILEGATITIAKEDNPELVKGCFHTSFDVEETYGCKPIEAGKRYNLKPYYYFCNYSDYYNDQEHAPFVVITDEMLQDKGSDKSISTITWGEFLNLGILEGPYSIGEGYNEEENAVIYDDYYVLVYDQNEYNAVTSDDLLCNTNGLMFY